MYRMDELRQRAAHKQSTADIPVFTHAITIDLDEKNSATLQDYGVKIVGAGSGNSITLEKDQRALDIQLEFAQASDCHVVLGRSKPISLRLTVQGKDNLICLAGVSDRQSHNRVTALIKGNRSLLHLGSDFTSVNSTLALFGEDRIMSFGPDCMLSWSIHMINYDQHTLFDMETGDVINDPTDMRIGRHVWIGQDALFTRGVSVGDGSIIGARALVASDIPPTSLAVGVPAKILRKGVSWTRAWMGHRPSIEETRTLLMGQIDGNGQVASGENLQ